MIEDFESYSSSTNPGAWGISGTGVNVSLGLNLTGPINGNNDLKYTAGIGLVGTSYVIQNQSLSAPVSALATSFRMKIRPILGLNVTRTIQVTLTGQDDKKHTSQAQTLSLATLLSTTDLDFPLNQFSQESGAAPISTVKGVQIKITNGLLSVAAEEHIDDLRMTWDNSSVPDWAVY